MTRKQKERTFQFPVLGLALPSTTPQASLLHLSFLPLKYRFTRNGEHLHPKDQRKSEGIWLQKATQLSWQGRQLVATSCLTLQEGGTQEKDVRAETTIDGSCSPPGTAKPPRVGDFCIPDGGYLST